MQDNGIGIRPNAAENIFKLLHRDISNPHFTGHGMGLALAKKIVNWHNGEISIEQPETEGALIHFTIETE